MMYVNKREYTSPPVDDYSESVDDQEDLFRSKVQVLWQEECFVDATLACDGKLLTAHKLVLSAYSDYFKDMFSSIRTNQYPVVFMKDVSYDVLEAILQFMYCGEVNVAQYNLNAFMKTAHNLKIKGLSVSEDQLEFQEAQDPQMNKQPQQLQPQPIHHLPQPQQVQLSQPQPIQHPQHSGKRRHGSLTENHMTSPPLKRMKQKTPFNPNLYQTQLPTQQNFEDDDDDEHSVDGEMESLRQPAAPKSLKFRHIQTPKAMTEHPGRNIKSGGNAHSSQHGRPTISHSSGKKIQAYVRKQEPVMEMNMPTSSNSFTDAPGLDGQSDSSSEEELHSIEASKQAKVTRFAMPNLQDSNNSASAKADAVPSKLGSQMGVASKSRDASPRMQVSKAAPLPTPPPPPPPSAKTMTSKQQDEVDSSYGDMSPENESRLVKFVDYMSQIAPLTCNQVRLFAWGIDTVLGTNKFGPDGPSKTWWNTFKKKNPKINKVLRSYDFLKASHLKPDIYLFNSLTDYLIPIQEIIEAFDLNEKPEHFWSCSEYTINVNAPHDVCLRSARERYFNRAKFPPDGDYISILLAGSASGKKISPFAVFKESRPGTEFTSSGPVASVYAQNPTGFMDSNLMLRWFEETFLLQCPQNRSEDEPVVLLINSIFPLVPPRMLDLALSENIIILSLMPHLHQACQPMDVAFVNGFQKDLRENLKSENIRGDSIKDILPLLIKEPFERSMTPEMIREGFRLCGIFPLAATMNQEEHLLLQTQLGFSDNKSFLETEKKNHSRKMKASTSDESDTQEDKSSCYICGKKFQRECAKKGTRLKCTKKYCKNYSCEDCLPMNCERNKFVCLDCPP